MVLDEAHTIKSSKSQVSVAAAALIADNRWCLTGTPIQVNYYIRRHILKIQNCGHPAMCYPAIANSELLNYIIWD